MIISFASLYLCGSIYWLSRLFLKKYGEFGEEPHLLEKLSGPIHLIAAFVFIFVTGIIWARHANPAMRLKRSRISGWLFYALMGSLAITGTVIIYGTETITKLVEQIHPILGVSLVPVLAFHWFKERLIKK